MTIWVSATDDDPDAAPVWGDWQLFDRTEVTGRGFRFRADITATSVSYRVAITNLEIVAEERA